MTLPEGKALRVTWGETLAELGKTDPRIVVLDGDLGSSTMASLFEAEHPDRFFQMGIAEQNMLGVAAGMATVGFIPWVSTFACFAVARALDSIRVLIAQPKLPVKIGGSYAGLLAGMTGKTHLMFDDVAIMRAMANMVTICPADEVEAAQAIAVANEIDGPVYVRLTRPESAVLFDDSYKFELGKVTTVLDGDAATVFSTGIHTTRVYEAAEALAEDGIHVKLVHVPTIKPLDEDAVVEAAKETGFVITAEEHTIIGGLGGAIAETLSDKHPVPVKRTGLGDVYGESGPNDALLEKYGISVGKITEQIKSIVEAR